MKGWSAIVGARPVKPPKAPVAKPMDPDKKLSGLKASIKPGIRK